MAVRTWDDTVWNCWEAMAPTAPVIRALSRQQLLETRVQFISSSTRTLKEGAGDRLLAIVLLLLWSLSVALLLLWSLAITLLLLLWLAVALLWRRTRLAVVLLCWRLRRILRGKDDGRQSRMVVRVMGTMAV